MRRGVAIGLAVASFVLGAWLSPRLTAQSDDRWIPASPHAGQRVIVSRPESTPCDVDKAVHQWVLCRGGMWRNLTNGTGYLIEDRR